jgi:putative transposase
MVLTSFETHFLYALKYVEQNPVKAYMAKYPWDYKYSSARYRLNEVKEDKLLSNYEPIDKILNYKEFLQEKTQTKLLKEKTRTGKPCGDDDFYDRIEILTGINYKNKKAGRPKKEQGFD